MIESNIKSNKKYYDLENSFHQTSIYFKKHQTTVKKSSTGTNWYNHDKEYKNEKEIVINLAYTKFPIIEQIAIQVFNWKVIKNE